MNVQNEQVRPALRKYLLKLFSEVANDNSTCNIIGAPACMPSGITPKPKKKRKGDKRSVKSEPPQSPPSGVFDQ